MNNFCAIIDCSNNSSREVKENCYVFRTFTSHSGQQTTEISQKRQVMWVAPLSLYDLQMDKLVMSVDWVFLVR